MRPIYVRNSVTTAHLRDHLAALAKVDATKGQPIPAPTSPPAPGQGSAGSRPADTK